MDTARLRQIRIESADRQRPQRALWGIGAFVFAVTLGAAYFAWPRADDNKRVVNVMGGKTKPAATAAKSELAQTAPKPPPAAPSNGKRGEAILTVSGYIINHKRMRSARVFKASSPGSA